MPFITIHCSLRFSAAHFLTQYKGKCERLHGHNYKLIVSVRGSIKANGMVMDFKDVQTVVKDRVLARVDHTLLNDLVPNPSAEHIAVWIWDQLIRLLPLTKIILYETDEEWVEYAGET